MAIHTVIMASGHYVPPNSISTEDLVKRENIFKKGTRELDEVILDENYYKTIGVKSRPYADDLEKTSDMGAKALINCFDTSFIDRSEISHVVVAHNTGDNKDIIPPISSKVASKAGLYNVSFFDIVAGCQGYVQLLDIVDSLARTGKTKKVAIVASEDLFRIKGKTRDQLLFSSSAAAVIVGPFESEHRTGILTTYTDGNTQYTDALGMCNRSIYEDSKENVRDMEMDGREVFKLAKVAFPETYMRLLKQANLEDKDIKLLIQHQASEKILNKSIEGIVQELDNTLIKDTHRREDAVKIYRQTKAPTSVNWLGNNSVVTTPLLFDLIMKKKSENSNLSPLLSELQGYSINEDDMIAKVAAGAGIGWGGEIIKMAPIYWDYLK